VTRGQRVRARFLGAGGTRRGQGSRPPAATQAALFDGEVEPEPDDEESLADRFELGELARDCRRMTLETSSGVYAQRRATW
jgi:hypothetical protein